MLRIVFSLDVTRIKLPYSVISLPLGKRPILSSNQAVRWYRPRKPFWLPTAKSKMFRIPEKPQIPEEERIEIVRLYNVYRTQMKSVQSYFKEYLRSQTTGAEVIAEQKQKEVELHAWCIEENNKWNAEVAVARQKRLALESVEREKKILDKILIHEKQQKELLSKVDEHIIMEKEAAKSFITPQNIDEALDNALKHVVDYNFCIDLQGNIYNGRYGKPSSSASATDPDQTTKVPLPAAEEVKAEVRS